jgi:hypothetical protein
MNGDRIKLVFQLVLLWLAIVMLTVAVTGLVMTIF